MLIPAPVTTAAVAQAAGTKDGAADAGFDEALSEALGEHELAELADAGLPAPSQPATAGAVWTVSLPAGAADEAVPGDGSEAHDSAVEQVVAFFVVVPAPAESVPAEPQPVTDGEAFLPEQTPAASSSGMPVVADVSSSRFPAAAVEPASVASTDPEPVFGSSLPLDRVAGDAAGAGSEGTPEEASDPVARPAQEPASPAGSPTGQPLPDQVPAEAASAEWSRAATLPTTAGGAPAAVSTEASGLEAPAATPPALAAAANEESARPQPQATGDADGFHPTAGTAPASQPDGVTPAGARTAVQAGGAVARLMEVIERLQGAPPPQRVVVELAGLEGLRLQVSLHGGTVRLAVVGPGSGEQPITQIVGDLSQALADRGFDLSGRSGGEREAGAQHGADVVVPIMQAKPKVARTAGVRL